jgi:hypothetical protein
MVGPPPFARRSGVVPGLFSSFDLLVLSMKARSAFGRMNFPLFSATTKFRRISSLGLGDQPLGLLRFVLGKKIAHVNWAVEITLVSRGSSSHGCGGWLHNPPMEPVVRTARQNATKVLKNAKKLGGPKTPEGNSRSSMNALRHGLSANNLLLPGEDAQEEESHLDGYFTTFALATLPEAQVVAQLGDLTWKVKRLTKLEDNRLHARLGKPSSPR